MVASPAPLPMELSTAQRSEIQAALDGAFSAPIDLQFETGPELVSGIELVAGGQKLGWTIAQYLTSLEQAVAELLKPADTPAQATSIEAEPTPVAIAG